MAKKVVLAGACRTAIGTMGGSLSTTPAAELGAIVIKEALQRAGVAPEAVDQVYMGCVIQAGLGQNVARQASIKAGLPIEVPAVTMNVVCGSGLNCVNQAAQMIMAGDADIVVAGGMENMSLAPYAVPQARFGYRMNNGTLVDCMIKDALWDAFNDYHMITTADNICREWGLTREELQQELELYEKSPSLTDQEEGLSGVELLSFSGDRVVVRKNYEKAEEGYYLVCEDHKVVVYDRSLTHMYLNTGILLENLPWELQNEIIHMKLIRTESELYHFLESYSS